ncbi:G-protein-signaling modulator 1 [Melanotaenia boesemani]|uniref:G-protein-signaling modulator 1 n=1 Tax=Melanotaenia boesemani TaxID=1250792 RepID=UPI001C03E2D5|nr:G-protein-signaling modulator 1 [Melanotaenia boesemani]XP_041855306.1 G-protein-signaling modulator 1 [Melanotaenia boesemani]
MRHESQCSSHFQTTIMADKNPSRSSSLSSPSQHNGRTVGAAPKLSSTSHQNGNVEPAPGHHSPSNPSPASISPLRTFRTVGGLTSPAPSSGSEGGSESNRCWGQSHSSALSLRTRTTNKLTSSQQAEPEDLLDLILESQCQRMEDQRASLSLLPEQRPAALCGACSPDLDFYYMLIRYQSDRMDDQRCSLPDLDDVVSPIPEGQEDFFSLVQRVQSRRMDEQRASMLLRHPEDDQDVELADSTPHYRHFHH